MLQIRKIKPEELSIAKQMIIITYQLSDIELSNIENIAVCISDNQLVGCGCSVQIEKQCYLHWICVEKEYRRTNLGTAIVKYLLNIEEKKGAIAAYLSTPCESFANKLGFTVLEKNNDIEIKNKFYEIYKDKNINSCYYASLINYFKPCHS